MKRCIFFMLVLLCVSVVLGDQIRTTRSVPQRSTAKNAPTGPKVIASSAYSLQYTVQQQWPETEITPKTDREHEFYLETADHEPAGNLSIHHYVNKDSQSLADLVKVQKDRIQGFHPEMKFTRDEAMKLGGSDAWILMYDLDHTPDHLKNPEPTAAPANPGKSPGARPANKTLKAPLARPAARPAAQGPDQWQSRYTLIIGTHDDVYVEIEYHVQTVRFAKGNPLFQNVLRSFKWAELPGPVVQSGDLKVSLPSQWAIDDDASVEAQAQAKLQTLYRHTRFNAKMGVSAKPADATVPDAAAAVAALQTSLVGQMQNQTFSIEDANLGGSAGKSLVYSYQPTSSCGYKGAVVKRIYTVAMHKGQVCQVMLETEPEIYEKQKAALDEVVANVKWTDAGPSASR